MDRETTREHLGNARQALVPGFIGTEELALRTADIRIEAALGRMESVAEQICATMERERDHLRNHAHHARGRQATHLRNAAHALDRHIGRIRLEWTNG